MDSLHAPVTRVPLLSLRGRCMHAMLPGGPARAGADVSMPLLCHRDHRAATSYPSATHDVTTGRMRPPERPHGGAPPRRGDLPTTRLHTPVSRSRLARRPSISECKTEKKKKEKENIPRPVPLNAIRISVLEAATNAIDKRTRRRPVHIRYVLFQIARLCRISEASVQPRRRRRCHAHPFLSTAAGE